MNVAKSFKDFEFIGDIYYISGKAYIKAKNPSTNNIRQIRVYTDKEYAKLYPDNKPLAQTFKNLKTTLGFNKGYITIFKNAGYDDEWCNMSNARWHESWGWYIISTEAIPADCPFEYAPLYWNDISKNNTLKSKDEIEQVIFSIFYDDSPSQHLGNIGERIEIEAEIIDIKKIETAYGIKAKYILSDNKGNIAEWFTGIRKNWDKGSQKNLRGTIKNLKKEQGINITVLTRCLERE